MTIERNEFLTYLAYHDGMKPTPPSFIDHVTLALVGAGFDAAAIAKVVNGDYARIPNAGYQPILQTIMNVVAEQEHDPNIESQLFALNELLTSSGQKEKTALFAEMFHYAPLARLDVAEVGSGFASLIDTTQLTLKRVLPLSAMFHSFELLGQHSGKAIDCDDDFISLQKPLRKKYDYIVAGNVLTVGAVQLSDRYHSFYDDKHAVSTIQIADLALALKNALKENGTLLHYGDHSERIAAPLLDPAFQTFGHLSVKAEKTETDAVIVTVTPTHTKRIHEADYKAWLSQTKHHETWIKDHNYRIAESPKLEIGGMKIYSDTLRLPQRSLGSV